MRVALLRAVPFRDSDDSVRHQFSSRMLRDVKQQNSLFFCARSAAMSSPKAGTRRDIMSQPQARHEFVRDDRSASCSV
jgi:hypothetical protein